MKFMQSRQTETVQFQDDALSQVIADMLKKIDPSSVLVPATPMGTLHLLQSGSQAELWTYRRLYRTSGGTERRRHLLYQTEQAFLW